MRRFRGLSMTSSGLGSLAFSSGISCTTVDFVGLARLFPAAAFARVVAAFLFLFARADGVYGSPLLLVRARRFVFLRGDVRVPGEVGCPGFALRNVTKCQKRQGLGDHY